MLQAVAGTRREAYGANNQAQYRAADRPAHLRPAHAVAWVKAEWIKLTTDSSRTPIVASQPMMAGPPP